jgi:sugar lactone lactonase YvrE
VVGPACDRRSKQQILQEVDRNLGSPGTLIARQPAANPIPLENENPGDSDWLAGASAAPHELDIYLSTDSAFAGDTVSAKVSSETASSINVEVFRIGYYAGAGARRIWAGGPYPVQRQADCPVDSSTGRIECHWSETFSLRVEDDWVSGIYMVKIRGPDRTRRFVPMVVRDTRAAEMLFQPAFNTYQAYNDWGGQSLYVSDTMPQGRAYEVSLNRPYQSADGTADFTYWEYPLVRLLEKDGYDVTYGTNLDFSRFSDFVVGIGLFVHAGHDEYWTVIQRDQVDRAVASGEMSLAYFGANGCYWRVRTLDDRQGNPLRTIVSYKYNPEEDPIPGSTDLFRLPPNANPEDQLFGSMYTGYQVVPFPLLVQDTNHWLFEGAELRPGEVLTGILGYEVDRVFPSRPANTEVLMTGPIVTAQGTADQGNVVSRTFLPNQNTVFSAGAIFWSFGLTSDPSVVDDRFVRMTQNVLERGLRHRRPARTLPSPGSRRPNLPVVIADWAPSVQALAGAGIAGWVDGPGNEARFRKPTGLAVNASGQIIVADTGNHVIRLIDTDEQRTVTTIAGTGEPGEADNVPGAQAGFRSPDGVVVTADGTIYVSETESHVIRRIENNPPTWTVSTYAGILGGGYLDSDDPRMARFQNPAALALDAEENLYVAEIAGNRIRKIERATGHVTTFAGSSQGFADSATGTAARFYAPSGLVVAPSGEIYVMDAGNQFVRRIMPNGAHPVDTIAGVEGVPQLYGHVDGSGAVAQFRAGMGMAMARSGDIFIADSANFRIRRVNPGTDRASTTVRTIAGSGLAGTRLGSGDVADIPAPSGLVLAPNQHLIVSDPYNHFIREITLP